MRRWNGWGEESESFPVPDGAAKDLARRIGEAAPPHDAARADVVASVPEPVLPKHPLVSTDPETRLLHARGQSLPDWIALRSGRIGLFPDGVAFPETEEHFVSLLAFAKETGAALVPYGGGTSVAGHVNPRPGRPTVTVSLAKKSALAALDPKTRLATFGAGATGPQVERSLGAQGFTLGHFPQSFELSTLGGWIVTRSSGQESLGYGRIESLFAGGRLVSPAGTLTLPPFPASAAGPDVREMVLGSEGRFGFVTDATIRISPLPRRRAFRTVFFPELDAALLATREIAQARLPLTMVRLSTPKETETALLLAGSGRAVRALQAYLSLRGAKDQKCQLLFGVEEGTAVGRAAGRAALSIARKHGGVAAPGAIGEAWRKNRFRGPYLRNSLWDLGYAVDTLETATTWDKVPAALAAVERALSTAIEATGEKVHVFTHLSHVYATGSSLYTTYVFRLAPDPDETLERWRRLKAAASEAIVSSGGTISHQHGVGVDHRPYLAAEKGALGLAAIGDLARRFDPDGLLNPGKLIE